jgi:alanyl-tRNA synthetase
VLLHGSLVSAEVDTAKRRFYTSTRILHHFLLVLNHYLEFCDFNESMSSLTAAHHSATHLLHSAIMKVSLQSAHAAFIVVFSIPLALFLFLFMF